MPNYFNPYYPTQPNAYPTNMNVGLTQQNVGNVQPQPQIQNGGFVSVRNEMEARNYPVAMGASVTFKDENSPYIYTKTMGFSQLDVPKFDKYKLVKETPAEPSNLPENGFYDDKPILDTIDWLKGQIEAIWGEIEGIKNDHKQDAPAKRNAKRDKDGDD